MHNACELLLPSPEFSMEPFTLTLPTGTVVFDGTDVVMTATGAEAVTYSVPSGVAPTEVDVKDGEDIQIKEVDPAPETAA